MTARPVVIVGVAAALAGLSLAAWAWRTLASARRRGVLAVRGPYGVVRHPQYLGLIVAALGMVVQRPRPEALVPLGILAVALWLLACREEARMEEDLGCVWRAYAYGRPAFLPRTSRGRETLARLCRRPNKRMDEKDFTAAAPAPAKGRAGS
jgi:protein-S-isoprenylcysteine O-methyltransferase Ste14